MNKTPIATRYNIRSVQNMLATIESWIEQTEETLDNAENADYPNEERIDNLRDRLDALGTARDALGEIN